MRHIFLSQTQKSKSMLVSNVTIKNLCETTMLKLILGESQNPPYVQTFGAFAKELKHNKQTVTSCSCHLFQVWKMERLWAWRYFFSTFFFFHQMQVWTSKMQGGDKCHLYPLPLTYAISTVDDWTRPVITLLRPPNCICAGLQNVRLISFLSTKWHARFILS